MNEDYQIMQRAHKWLDDEYKELRSGIELVSQLTIRSRSTRDAAMRSALYRLMQEVNSMVSRVRQLTEGPEFRNKPRVARIPARVYDPITGQVTAKPTKKPRRHVRKNP